MEKYAIDIFYIFNPRFEIKCKPSDNYRSVECHVSAVDTLITTKVCNVHISSALARHPEHDCFQHDDTF